jgi:hypothetical protein
MNWIIDKSNKINFHTYLEEILVPLKEDIINYNWILSDLEYGGNYSDETPINMERDYFVLGPEEFNVVLKNHIQFYWGVIIAVPNSFHIQMDETKLPYAEGNNLMWKNGNMQYSDAEIEIICFDSGYTIVKFANENLSNKFKSYFDEAIDLEKFK